MEPARVKICGITSLNDGELATSLGAWAIGMIFYGASPRSCALEEAERIAAALRRRVALAGVFVNAPLEEVARIAERVGLELVQLHGDEGPAFCAEVARRTGARVIKAMPVANSGSLQQLERFHTDFHLLDGYVAGLRGGGGQPFDWSLVPARRRGAAAPLIVSGGLHAGNVAEAIALTRPYAVDVASGVEAAPGVKDEARMRDFFDSARAALVA